MDSNSTDNTTGKTKKPIWKKWWFWLGVLLVVIVGINSGGGGKGGGSNGGGTDVVSGYTVDLRDPLDEWYPPMVFYFDDGDVTWVGYERNSQSISNNLIPRFERKEAMYWNKGTYTVVDSGGTSIVKCSFKDWNFDILSKKDGQDYTFELEWSDDVMKGKGKKYGEGKDIYSITSKSMN